MAASSDGDGDGDGDGDADADADVVADVFLNQGLSKQAICN